MSDKITYVLEILDRYSNNTRKFKEEINSTKKAAESLDTTLTKTTKNYSRSLGNMRKTLSGSYTPIKFNTEQGKYENAARPRPHAPSGAGGVSFGGVAKAMGYYAVIDKVMGLPKEIFDTRRNMDSLSASLTAILPKYDGLTDRGVLAAREMEYMKKASYDLGISFNSMSNEYIQFLAASAGKSSLKEVREQFEAFAKIATTYQISPHRFSLVMNAITQMTSKGTLQMEELKSQLQESLPGALKLFTDAAKKVRPDLIKTEGDFMKLVASGRAGSGILKLVGKEILSDKDIIAGFEVALKSINSRTNQLSNSWINLLDNFSKGTIGDTISEGIHSLDLKVQSLNTSLGALSAFWNSDEMKFLRNVAGKGAELITSGAKVTGAAVSAIYYDIKHGGNEGRKTFNEQFRAGTKEEENVFWIRDAIGESPSMPNMTPIPNMTPMAQPEQKIVIEFMNAPANMSIPRASSNVSVRNSSTISPAGGY